MPEPNGDKKSITLTLAQKGLVLIAVPFVFELIFIVLLTALVGQAERESVAAERAKAIISTSNVLTKLMIEAGGALSGYSLHKEAIYAEHYAAAVEQLPEEVNELKKLTLSSPAQEQRLFKIKQIVDKGLELVKRLKASLDAEPGGGAATVNIGERKAFDELQSLTDSLERELSSFVADEQRLEKVSPRAEQRSRSLVHELLWIGIVLNILLAIFMARFFYNGITGRVKILTENALKLAKQEPLNPALAGSDEVAYLDRVFHDMAAALTESRRKERSVIDNALDVICSIDENGKFIAVSPASVNVWGYEPDELIGRRFTDLISPEDIESTLDFTRQIMLEKALVPIENRVVRKNGTLVYILWSAYWSPSEKCMFCVAHDINDRKRAEDLLRESELRTRSIIESMPVGLLMLSDDGQIELVNPQMERMFDQHAEELIGRHVTTLFPKTEEFLPQNFKAGAVHKLIGRVREFTASRKSGAAFPAELTFINFNTASGPRLLINVLDVTERHSMERLKREFVTTVSHELRTPLTSIRGSMTLLAVGALGPLADPAMKAVKIAERNSLRLANLINDLLDIEKLEAGRMDMSFETVKLSSVCEKALESVRPYADQYAISLELRMERELEVSADGDRLVQVVINLLSNACKFSPRNDTILLTVTERGEDVEVAVIDHGRGIPEETLPRIFERFQQVEISDSKRKGGTGLGLAICKAIIEQHSGKIGVDSEFGKGSKFWFRLPRIVAEGDLTGALQDTKQGTRQGVEGDTKQAPEQGTEARMEKSIG